MTRTVAGGGKDSGSGGGAADPRRKAELAVIHLGRKALALDEETYRDFLAQTVGKRSAADLSPAERQRVIEAMRARGFRQESWGGLGGSVAKILRGGGTRLRPHQAKVKALWRALWNLGALRDGSDAALDTWIRSPKGAGVEALRFADAKACNMAIQALRDWCAREGFETTPGEPGVASKRSLARAIWRQLEGLGQVLVPGPNGLDGWLRGGGIKPHKTSLMLLSPDELDHAIEKLGAWLRRARGDGGPGQGAQGGKEEGNDGDDDR